MIWKLSLHICDALRDLVPFVQFKKREKHPWKDVTFSKVASLKPATLLKLTLLHGYFFMFFKLCKWYQIAQRTIYFTHQSITDYPSKNQILSLSWRRSLSYRNHSMDLHSKSINWFLYDRVLRHERVKTVIFFQQLMLFDEFMMKQLF